MAIDKHELRIGSQLQDARVMELHNDHAIVLVRGDEKQKVVYNELLPQNLTPSYLQIAGFEQLDHGWHRMGMYLYQEDGGRLFIKFSGPDSVYSKQVLTAHHLQNLFFDLTGHTLPDNVDDRDAMINSN